MKRDPIGTTEAARDADADIAGQDEAIRVNDLHKSFGMLEVLKGVSLTAQKGDVVAIIGGSGSGKSTFLRCINFLETPSAGQIVVNGEEIKMRQDGTPVDRRQIERIRTRLGMVFQAFNLWTHRTLLENVIEVPVYVLKVPRDEAIKRARLLLERVGLGDKADTFPAFLSGGQQQRAAIARALALNPNTGHSRAAIVEFEIKHLVLVEHGDGSPCENIPAQGEL